MEKPAADAIKRFEEAFSSLRFENLAKGLNALHDLKASGIIDPHDAERAIVGLKAIAKILSAF